VAYKRYVIPIITGATGTISKSFRKHLSTTQFIFDCGCGWDEVSFTPRPLYTQIKSPDTY
jgi:hypothetical protein